jgi:amylosucrase
MRISGTMASLAGLEQAIDADDAELKEQAIRRMLLLYAVTLSIGGIPLLYLGEEWGMLNDYDFVNDPAKAGDTRWIHRPKMRWEFLEELHDDGSIRNRIFTSAQRMIQLRKELPALADLQMELVATANPHVLGYLRMHAGNRLLVLANFSDEPQTVAGNRLRTAGLGRFFQDRISNATLATSTDVCLEPYGFLWLERV